MVVNKIFRFEMMLVIKLWKRKSERESDIWLVWSIIYLIFYYSVNEFLRFTSKVVVERAEVGTRVSVKEQG